MNEKYDNLLKNLKDTIEAYKPSNDKVTPEKLNDIYQALDAMVGLIEQQGEEITQLEKQLNIKPAHETKFDRYQLDLLEYIFTNQSINEGQLAEFYKKDGQYRVAFTKLKDEYVYKGWGGIYSDAVNYHIKPEKEKYVAEELAKAFG